jgi:hypothetical protein
MNSSIIKRVLFTAAFSFFFVALHAQSTTDTVAASLDTTMRSHNKIYVVMAVCVVILAAVFLYLVRIDRKIAKKEKAV